MSSGLFGHQTSTLRAIIDEAGVLPLPQLMRLPAVKDVYRVTVYHHDGRARDVVATLIDQRNSPPYVEVAYRAALRGKTLKYPATPTRFESFARTLQQIQFDRLPDQPDLPTYGADLWLIERAAGTFNKSVILAPPLAEGAYYTLVAAVKTYLPEALREIN